MEEIVKWIIKNPLNAAQITRVGFWRALSVDLAANVFRWTLRLVHLPNFFHQNFINTQQQSNFQHMRSMPQKKFVPLHSPSRLVSRLMTLLNLVAQWYHWHPLLNLAAIPNNSHHIHGQFLYCLAHHCPTAFTVLYSSPQHANWFIDELSTAQHNAEFTLMSCFRGVQKSNSATRCTENVFLPMVMNRSQLTSQSPKIIGEVERHREVYKIST